MMDRGLTDVIIARIAPLAPAEKILLCKACECEQDLTSMTKTQVERIIGRSFTSRAVWNMDDFRAQAERDASVARMRGIGYVSYRSPLYPPLLREIWDPPVLLFYRGRLPDPERSALAVVGTRNPSPPALLWAYDTAKILGGKGIPVISGLARGIDAIAHRGNIDGGGATIAVLGSGLDEIYPAINRPLARRIVERDGVLLSEYPPGTKPRKWHFPARNRIISGLARGIVIAEAPEASGALITARFALEQGRDLWVSAVGVADGPYASLRGGGKKLAEDGAPVLSSAEGILQDWFFASPSSSSSPDSFSSNSFSSNSFPANFFFRKKEEKKNSHQLELENLEAEEKKEKKAKNEGEALGASLAKSLNIVYKE
ncbi:MAG: DNA-processing protein DprA [Spirochaetaceae bacterium]|jgi:DNA processing protein|nr:DNA-processing protein DprA [Spirochaetaceae bacterium]